MNIRLPCQVSSFYDVAFCIGFLVAGKWGMSGWSLTTLEVVEYVEMVFDDVAMLDGVPRECGVFVAWGVKN
jgi:hypothetical protein